MLIFARRYWPQMMLPVTIPVGCLGLRLESKFRSVAMSLHMTGDFFIA